MSSEPYSAASPTSPWMEARIRRSSPRSSPAEVPSRGSSLQGDPLDDVLVDSSVFIHLLRRGIDPVEALREEFGALDIVTCGIVKIAVLRGMKTPKARAHMESFLSGCQCVPSNNALWDAATDLAWSMDRAGQVIPATDLLIAVGAQRVGASILTLDHHFSMIPRLSMARVPPSWLK